MTIDEQYNEICEIIVAAGGTPFPITDTLIAIIKKIVTEEEMGLVRAFREKKSQTMEQLLETTGMPEAEITGKAKSLAAKGVIFDQPNSKGLMVYRLLPLVNVGVFEYTFMQKLVRSEENRELAELFTILFKELKSFIQDSYDQIIDFMDYMPPVDRTVPFRTNRESGKSTIIEINETIEQPAEKILQTSNVADLIEKFDEIAVGYCFCRHHKDMMDEPCTQTDLRETCFTFGKSARYTTSQGFMRMIDKTEALEILLKCEEDGLVHKAYHPNFDVSKDETSVCNCCKCCCGNGIGNQLGPIVNAANFLARVDPDLCTGCETCTSYCHADAITLNTDSVSQVNSERCIGCGVCAHFCPESAIVLVESDRIVRFAPPKE